MNVKHIALGGVASIVAIGAAALFLSTGPGTDLGGRSQSEIRGVTPTPVNDSMKPVGPTEADRRAVVNRDRAEDAAKAGKGAVAPPVIVSAQGPTLGELPERPAVPAPPPPPPPPVIQYVYVEKPQEAPAAVPVADPVFVARINSQIDALLTAQTGGFTVRHFPKPERPQAQPVQKASAAPLPARRVMVARAGDVATAILDRGFNTDDPAAPIFATITDIDDYGRIGPLNNVRLMGTIVTSATQASIQFQNMVFQNGQMSPIRAIAISTADARTAIASDVDNHVLERYGSMFLAAAVTGAGQVGQMMLQANRSVLATTTGTYVSAANVDWRQAALGAALPVGQSMTSALANKFNRPATMTSPTGMPVGIVFMEPVLLPAGAGR